MKCNLFAVLLILVGLVPASMAPAHAVHSDSSLIDGFEKTVFGSEYSGFVLSSQYVRKFQQPVRFHVKANGFGKRKADVTRFLRRLSGLIKGLDVEIVSDAAKANFVVHIVRRRDYGRTVRDEVFSGRDVTIRGRCMVRAVFSRRGISRSDAVIVADEGDALFQRCMVEEILQGLGPLNDDRSLKASMFNDATNFTSFRRFDRILLNMLYDPRIRAGASKRAVVPLLPEVVRDVKRRIYR
ncbi:MAG: DUF2927 domain-containing protein [Ahrensia sp.]|nr:DUF2927 domain-containing protein [Ahrensia sp.]